MTTFQAVICPDDLRDHLNLHSDKFADYQAMRREVERILVARGSVGNAMPSDVTISAARKDLRVQGKAAKTLARRRTIEYLRNYPDEGAIRWKLRLVWSALPQRGRMLVQEGARAEEGC